MKVGIMSMQRIINYGSFLQAYGLKKIIESFGHSVEFVDYRIEKPVFFENGEVLNKNLNVEKVKRVIKMLSPKYRRWRKKQIRLNKSFNEFIETFQRDYFPILGLSDTLNILSKTDVLVIGSDEVFNCTQTGNQVGYSKQLFGKDCRADKLISYAASFGNTTYEKLQKVGIASEIGKLLSEFSAISVRDKNSGHIVEKLTGVQAEKNIDPVLLYLFPEVEKVKVNLKDYIVVYAYADRITDEEARAIRKFAVEKGKKIISLGFYQPFCDEYLLVSPIEVLAYIKNADYIITDTFHGTVFSIKYQKRFGTIIRKSNQEKLGDLLNTFGLESRQIIDLNELQDVVEADVDQEAIRTILEEKQKEAMDYLKREL